MDRSSNNKKININLVLTLVVAYILIRCIDNYSQILHGLGILTNILTPFIIAFILAYIFNPIINVFEKRLKTKRTVSLFIIYAVLVSILIGILILTLPIIVDSVVDIANKVPIYLNETEAFIMESSRRLDSVDPNTIKDIIEKIYKILPNISDILIGSLGEIFRRTFSFGRFIFNFVLAFIICFYILLEKEKFGDFSKKIILALFGRKKMELSVELAKTLNENVGRYFTGKILDSMIVGVLSGIGLYFLKSEYALLFGTLMCVMNMIPYFGPVIGMTPVVIINLFTSPQTALFCLIYLFLVQQVEVAFIEPKVVGGQLGLSPFFTILAVTVGGGLFGIPGMILSTPLLGVFKIYFTKYLNKRISETENNL